VVIDDIDPEGKVRIKDEIWDATAKGEKVEQGERVRIVGSRGLVLVVEDVEEKVYPAKGASEKRVPLFP